MMKIQVLGGHGGVSKGFSATSYLIDDKLLVDAGGVTSSLSIEEQSRIDHILISHTHLDHIKDLAFICDNCFGMRAEPFKVHTHETVKKSILAHLLNDIVWPDFTKIPTKDRPTMSIEARDSEKQFRAGDFDVTPVKVNHPLDAMGFIIEIKGDSVLFTLDTGPTERIWEVAKKVKNLKAIFTEISFPNSMSKVAELSHHHTTATLGKEIAKMPGGIPIILTHFKPNYRSEIEKEVRELGNSRISLLKKDGEVFQF
jgi:ribonuclease BN (tRNA processing enzyme)